MTNRMILLMILVLVFLPMSSCRKIATEDPVSLSFIKISPEPKSLKAGDVLQLQAEGTYSDLSKLDLSASVEWKSSNKKVAAFDQDTKGLLQALTSGKSMISASYQGVEKKVELEVSDLKSIEILPESPVVALGTALELVAVAHFGQDATQDVSAEVKWESSNATVAWFDEEGPNSSSIRSRSVGSTEITASMGDVSASTVLKVTSGELEFIEVSPPLSSLSVGVKQSFSAIGVYSDQTKINLTESVVWQISDSSVADFDAGIQDQKVTLQAANAGNTELTAQNGAVQGQALIQVDNFQLESIEVASSVSRLNQGSRLTLRALGVYTDGESFKVRDISNLVQWNSSDSTIGIVGNLNKGAFEALKEGSVEITASLEGVEGARNFKVLTGELSSIQINPPFARMQKGSRAGLSATGVYSNDLVMDLSGQVLWSSLDESVAGFTQETSKMGFLKGTDVGKTLVSATLGQAGASLDLEVFDSGLESIEISPLQKIIATGTQTDFRAIGIFSNQEVLDLTPSVIWRSSETTTLAVRNDGSFEGKTSGLAQGNSKLTASFQGASASLSIKIEDKTLEKIQIEPVETGLALGTRKELRATAVFDDETSVDITSLAVWKSSDPSILKVSNQSGRRGEIESILTGSANVSAYWEGRSASILVEVTQAELVSIEIAPSLADLRVGNDLKLQATGTFSDSTIQNLTKYVIWKSSDEESGWVANGPNDPGRFIARKTGEVEITAGFGSVVGSAKIVILGIAQSNTIYSP